jgi:hypothetical protein
MDSFGRRWAFPSGGIEEVQVMRRYLIPLLPLVTALSAAVAADPPSPKPDKPAENKAPLVCELRDLPEKARPGEELKLIVRLRNTSDKSFPLLGHHVEYVTSVGTGVGISIRRVAKRDAEKAPEQPTLKLRSALARMELLGGAYPKKPEDILAVLTDKEIPGGKSVSIPVTVTLPKEPGEYEVSAYVRSWASFGIRNDIPLIDPKEVDRLYVDRVASECRLVLVGAK